MSISSGGILAAGDGSRFKRSGITIHKPLICVNGFPLIGHTLKNFESCGIKKIVIIFNETESECVQWVKENFPRLEVRFIVKSTNSSYESFLLVGKALGIGRHLITTVDSFCELKEFEKIADDFEAEDSSLYLGVTNFVQDEKPLWVSMNQKSNRITQLGLAQGDAVTCGFYNISDHIFNLKPEKEMASLRFYLKWLLERQIPMVGVSLGQVIDIDDLEDLKSAEAMFKKGES
ncbi:MAG: NTP transferase domain-containing protein [Elusimicrobia bacterium]|nr:NTP transferase domain-containing protein [Elusimicrobiota bacterium]